MTDKKATVVALALCTLITTGMAVVLVVGTWELPAYTIPPNQSPSHDGMTIATKELKWGQDDLEAKIAFDYSGGEKSFYMNDTTIHTTFLLSSGDGVDGNNIQVAVPKEYPSEWWTHYEFR